MKPLLYALLLFAAPCCARADDASDVRAVVDAYPRYVTAGNRAGFESLLLDTDITFRGVYDDRIASSRELQDYAHFRQGVFESGHRYTQAFSNVAVEVHGDIAEASLDFVTTDLAQPSRPTKGWKILQLVKTKAGWRIAAELWGVAR
ncbi:nuclear transport factor 2 family protein [Luteibacter yeojuensis]|uniref:SnoaL-like domain-containing protein n=1 Tax=Luteibacter yeojuensis TaxID=345309 RepID=A0A0F3L0Y9_9GAMM|nr:nuclear transport factor 2 family protein [Luteibacter yeojuensis]KJV36887.1 hypothetical protein VI08_01405 [Luteibacter yeojuensis]